MLSYDIERWFYLHLASSLPPHVKIARAYPSDNDMAHNLLLEDLSVEFPYSASGSMDQDATICVLNWLAGFHGTYFQAHRHPEGVVPIVPAPRAWREGSTTCGVWQRGTYFYLETRREELEETDREEYAWLFPWIEKVNDAIEREIQRYGTIVHGDVKSANIVFNRRPSRTGKKAYQAVTDGSIPLRCALYDFQYVGLGLPALDLVYFLGMSVSPSLLSPSSEKELLQVYHASLQRCLTDQGTSHESYAFNIFWHHWELAIVDWYRFMTGWGFWGNDNWVRRRAREIMRSWETQNRRLP
ncbi:hypothetical protein EIP86_011546 [Pleurotus ostreatoroseus]|nr:hypothetical protein EIP86_011546 [Pleurotus ostreatoroseus]